MNITIPPSETDRHISSIKWAIERKQAEIDKAHCNLDGLNAEMRGLKAALDIITLNKEAM